jgi:hypothetical protein
MEAIIFCFCNKLKKELEETVVFELHAVVTVQSSVLECGVV